MLVMALAIVLPLVYISRRHKDGKTVKKPLIAHCFGFFGLVAMATVFGFACSGTAFAADAAANAANASGIADGLKYVISNRLKQCDNDQIANVFPFQADLNHTKKLK